MCVQILKQAFGHTCLCVSKWTRNHAIVRQSCLMWKLTTKDGMLGVAVLFQLAQEDVVVSVPATTTKHTSNMLIPKTIVLYVAE